MCVHRWFPLTEPCPSEIHEKGRACRLGRGHVRVARYPGRSRGSGTGPRDGNSSRSGKRADWFRSGNFTGYELASSSYERDRRVDQCRPIEPGTRSDRLRELLEPPTNGGGSEGTQPGAECPGERTGSRTPCVHGKHPVGSSCPKMGGQRLRRGSILIRAATACEPAPPTEVSTLRGHILPKTPFDDNAILRRQSRSSAGRDAYGPGKPSFRGELAPWGAATTRVDAAGTDTAAGPGRGSGPPEATAVGPAGAGASPGRPVVGRAVRRRRIGPGTCSQGTEKLTELAGWGRSSTTYFADAPAAVEAVHGPAVISPTPPEDIHGRGIAAPIDREAARSACISATRFHRAWGAFFVAGDNVRPPERWPGRRRVVVLRHSAYTRCLREVKRESEESACRPRRGEDKSKQAKPLRLEKKIQTRFAHVKARFR